jgi:hypothetical protein
MVEPDKQTGQVIVRAAVFKDTPVIGWGVLIGDFIHNLRSALDQLTWALTVLYQGAPPVPLTRDWKRVAFPIFTDRQAYEEITRSGNPTPRSGLAKIWGIPDPIRTAIHGLQPFNSGQDAPRHSLAVLEELWNTDKHRFVNITGALAEIRNVSLDAPDPWLLRWTRGPGPFVHRTELFRFQYVGAGPIPSKPNVKVKLDGTFGVAFEQGPPAYGGELGYTLESLQNVVTAIYHGCIPVF